MSASWARNCRIVSEFSAFADAFRTAARRHQALHLVQPRVLFGQIRRAVSTALWISRIRDSVSVEPSAASSPLVRVLSTAASFVSTSWRRRVQPVRQPRIGAPGAFKPALELALEVEISQRIGHQSGHIRPPRG